MSKNAARSHNASIRTKAFDSRARSSRFALPKFGGPALRTAPNRSHQPRRASNGAASQDVCVALPPRRAPKPSNHNEETMTQDLSTQPVGEADPKAPAFQANAYRPFAGVAQCGVAQCDPTPLQAPPAINVSEQ